MAKTKMIKSKNPLYSARQEATIIPETDNGNVLKRIAEIHKENLLILMFFKESIFYRNWVYAFPGMHYVLL